MEARLSHSPRKTYTKTSFELQWKNNFSVLEEFKSVHLREPKSGEVYKGVAIGKWLATQRLNYHEKRYPLHRKELLESIGIYISGTKWDAEWAVYAKAYEAFIKEFGLPYVEKGTVFNGCHLYWWAVRQRQKMRRGDLSQDKISHLNTIGFVWDSFSSKWREHIIHYGSYIDNYRKEPSINEVYCDFQIGVWYELQKRRKRAGTLSSFKIKQLEAVGIVW